MTKRYNYRLFPETIGGRALVALAFIAGVAMIVGYALLVFVVDGGGSDRDDAVRECEAVPVEEIQRALDMTVSKTDFRSYPFGRDCDWYVQDGGRVIVDIYFDGSGYSVFSNALETSGTDATDVGGIGDQAFYTSFYALYVRSGDIVVTVLMGAVQEWARTPPDGWMVEMAGLVLEAITRLPSEQPTER